MGILSNLFKQKSVKSGAEGRPKFAASVYKSKAGDSMETPAVEGGTASQEETSGMPQRNIAFGRPAQNPEPSVREKQEAIASNNAPAPGKVPGQRSHTRSLVPVKAAGISDKPISIDIDDVMAQMPREFLKGDRAKNTKKSLVFNTYELLPGISQGKATATISRIAQLAPELFNAQDIPPDAQVELPLEKIVAQIGVFPGRPDQVKEIYPPLDGRYANLVLEKGGLPRSPEAVVAPETTAAEVPQVQAAPVTPVESAQPQAAAEVPTVEAPMAEKGMNGSVGNGSEKHPDAETVSYSLAAIFPHVPPVWLDGKLKSVDHTARITVPFDLVEVQLASGRVELPFPDFFQALPENLKEHFSGGKNGAGSAKVLIPLHEVFQNLPGVEPLPPPPARPVVPEPADEVVTPEIPGPAEPEAKAGPIEEEPAVTQAAAPVVEEQKPAEPEPAVVAPESAEPVVPAAPASAVTEEAPPAKVEEPIAQAGPAAVVEPEPVAPPTVESIPEPAKVEIAEPAQPRIEPPQLGGQTASEFITPQIQVRRIAPPPIFAPQQFVHDPSINVEEEQSPAPESTAPHVEPVANVAPAVHEEPVAHVRAAARPKTAIRDMIVIDGKLDTRKTVEHLILLPGIAAAALTIKSKSRLGGEFPANFHPYETGKTLFQSLESHAPKGPAAIPRAVTLHHENFATTHFKQGGITLCVLHPEGPLDAGAHHAVSLVLQEIVRLRQH